MGPTVTQLCMLANGSEAIANLRERPSEVESESETENGNGTANVQAAEITEGA